MVKFVRCKWHVFNTMETVALGSSIQFFSDRELPAAIPADFYVVFV